MFVEQLGRDNAKTVDVPAGFDPDHFGYGRESHKATKEELDEWDVSQLPMLSRTTVYWSLVMRVAYMAADRAELAKFLTKMIKLAKMVQTPKECDVQRIQLCERQKISKMIKCYGDSDHVGDAEWRRSNISQMSGISVLECMDELLHDWSITKKFRVMTDDSSRKAFASKRGLDKMKHIQTRYLWIQE